MSILRGNAIVGQSGGPTAAINATLAGVIYGAMHSENIGRVYGMKNGIDGLLADTVIELDGYFPDDDAFEVLKRTPAAALGSCRKKLPTDSDPKYKQTFEKIIEQFKKYDIRYFFYIGGNDSMDTVAKLSKYTSECGYEVSACADNDVIRLIHCFPGRFTDAGIKTYSSDNCSGNSKNSNE